MPYNADGSKKKNPTKKDWYVYHLRNGTLKKNQGFKNGSKSSASNTGGASVGG